MGPLDLVKLTPLRDRTGGNPEIAIGLIDGPVAMDHPDLAGQRIHVVSEKAGAACSRFESVACQHGTFVAGVLCARRGSDAPAICPDCTLLVRPIFSETASASGDMPSAKPEALASAIIETVEAGARILNLSAALVQPSSKGENTLRQALDYAARKGVIVVAAAGNQGTLCSSGITRHPWVIPVAACDGQGKPLDMSNLGNSIGRLGLSAPGNGITSLGADGQPRSFGGTSAATPFVTGAIALLWSEFPGASAAQVKMAVMQTGGRSRRTIAPPLLDAWAAYQLMASSRSGSLVT